MTLALVVGTLLAVGALAYVLYPIFFVSAKVRPTPHAPRPAASSGQESAIVALREIEFDRETGKLSDVDYRALKEQYTRHAILAMRREAAAGEPRTTAQTADDEIEAAVRAYRAQHLTCPTCGPRPESDAVFCSTCGRYLHDRCADCGAPVVALDARYCVSCGNQLAA